MRQTENWTVWAKKADFQEIGKKYGIDQVTARIMRNRDIITDEEINSYLNGTMDMLPSPYLLKDVKKAAGILAEKINTDKMNAPSFMMVLTGTGDFAYRRKDGVFVVPIGCLKD